MTTCVVVRQEHAVVKTVIGFHIEGALQICVYKSERVVRARQASTLSHIAIDLDLNNRALLAANTAVAACA